MALGALIRDLRLARGWSQGQLAERLCLASGEHVVTREKVSRWEREKVIPGPRWRGILSATLDVPSDTLDEEARMSRVNRRAFLSLSALTAAQGKFAAEILGSVTAKDAGPLTTVQTKYSTDLVIASIVDRPAAVQLRRWMKDGSNPILRVNATGILAKAPDYDFGAQIADTLARDDGVRRLYMTAVVARSGALPWTAAAEIVNTPTTMTRQQMSFLASRLADEALNPRDTGARWCSAMMLRELAPVLR